MNDQKYWWDFVISICDKMVKFILVISIMHFFTNIEEIKSIHKDILIELSRK